MLVAVIAFGNKRTRKLAINGIKYWNH
jgi:hypothetical protein